MTGSSGINVSPDHTGEADSSPPPSPPYQDAPLPMFDGTDIFYEELDTSQYHPDPLHQPHITVPVAVRSPAASFQPETSQATSQYNSTAEVDEIDSIVAARIYNDLPTHLIYVPEMRLMGRAEIQKTVQPRIARQVQEAQEAPTSDQSSQPDSTLTRIAERELGYAILSHRWLSEGEPTFQDMLQFSRDGIFPGDAGAGFYKLVKFCMTGLAHGLNWAWADTCCIDKTKSSELDEAIRSMYRWYRDAKVCIVYLADTLYRTDMPRDAWFTRGWTLQELLAPARIKFYNRRWEPLAAQVNDRWDLDFLKTLSEITDIPVANLQAFAPGTRHVSRIMTWASKRETTRVEDVAYSLIGLFDVSLMPAYGEGEKAFYRLQLAIMERSRSFKLLMWDGEASREHSMIAGSPDCFTNTPPVYRHPPVWVRDVGNRYGHKWSILDLDTMIARGGTFAMTNAGLRIDLVIYDLCMDITTEESSFHFPLLSEEPGEFVANHRVRWKLQDGEGVAEFDFAGPLGVANRPRIWRFSIGVMDFEWNDAHYKSESLERILACDPLGTSDADTPSNGAEAVEIRGILELIRNRRDRAYIVVFLEERGDVGGSRCFRMIKHGPRIHRIRRPWDGWRRSETVYIMGN